MNRKQMMMIKLTAVVALAVYAISGSMQMAKADHTPQVLSSISEFQACVAFQNNVPVDKGRVIWDVQSASCYVVTPDAAFVPVPEYIEAVVKERGI